MESEVLLCMTSQCCCNTLIPLHNFVRYPLRSEQHSNMKLVTVRAWDLYDQLYTVAWKIFVVKKISWMDKPTKIY